MYFALVGKCQPAKVYMKLVNMVNNLYLLNICMLALAACRRELVMFVSNDF